MLVSTFNGHCNAHRVASHATGMFAAKACAIFRQRLALWLYSLTLPHPSSEMGARSRPEEVVRSVLTHEDAVQMSVGVNPSWHQILAGRIDDLS